MRWIYLLVRAEIPAGVGRTGGALSNRRLLLEADDAECRRH